MKNQIITGFGIAVSFILRMLIRFYQLAISPLLYLLFPGLGCRFTPTCSQYAYECILLYGPWKGIYAAVKRIGRCHPFQKGGVDLPSSLR